MPHADFVHLRVHTAYSLSEGAIKVVELAARCRAERMPAVAITDRGNLFGALEFSLECEQAGVQPIIGSEIAVRHSAGDGPRRGGGGHDAPPDWLVLLAQNEAGYANLMALSSKAFLETESGEAPQVELADLEAHSEGLIALTGGPSGPIGRLLLEGQAQAARTLLMRLAAAFPGRLYVELMRHGLDEEERIEPALLDLAFEFELPLVATNDTYFSEPDMFEAHDVLLCIAQGVHVDDTRRRRLTPDHGLRSAAEMQALFADLPEAVNNTLVVARRCAFMVPKRDPILPPYPLVDDGGEADALRTLARAGLARRLEAQLFTSEMDEADRTGVAKAYWERLEYELNVIIDMKFPGYFLIVADFIRWAKEHHIPVGPGRGSGAGSVVAWALSITDLDPLRFGLLFERFLNPERVSMPDFDIDFCQDRRDEVIAYVCQRYGADRVAQIITFGKLQARAVLRDVGRALGMAYGHVDRICKLVPYIPANPVSLQQAIDGEPQLQAMRDDDPAVTRLLAIALRLEGLYRHASTHAAGVVIGDRPLNELVPLYRDPRSDMPVTQFSMKYAEMAGLVKFDFLGLKTLSVLDRTVQLIARGGDQVDLATIPFDDAPTYETMSRGETLGVFQFESSGMRDLLREAGVHNIEDVIALIALYRPGPMENIPKYIACKRGKEKPEFLHETIEPITADTYGVIIYQEQVMQIAQAFASFSLGQADLLRRAMGKKIKAEMRAQRGTFIDGAMQNGVPRARAEYVFDLVDKFAGYGFNKAHSAGYALVAYQTAYLKANYPVEFLAASMSFELNNTDKIGLFRQELDRLGIALLAPDINASEVAFAVEGPPPDGPDGSNGIRYALAAIKNVGAQAMRSVVREREANGPYADLFDFASRLDNRIVNKRQLENLARAGAFDCLNPNRRQVYEAVQTLMHHAGRTAAERESNQVSLFEGEAAGYAAPSDLPEVPDWPPLERLMHEQQAAGLYLSAHPLDGYDADLARLGVTPLQDVAAQLARGTTRFRIAGVVMGVQERSAGPRRYAFVQLSDPGMSCEVAVFQEVHAVAREILEPGRAVLMTANARAEGDSVKLTAQTVDDLAHRVAGRLSGFSIRLKDAEPLARLKAILDREGDGRGQIALVVETAAERAVAIDLPTGYALTPALRAELGALPGILSIQDL